MKSTFGLAIALLAIVACTPAWAASEAKEMAVQIVKSAEVPKAEAPKVEAAKEAVKEVVKEAPKVEAPKKAEAPKTEAPKRAEEVKKSEEITKNETAVEVKDTCGGASKFLALRALAKDEQPLPGSRKIDLSKLPSGTRVFKANEPHPQQNVYSPDTNLKRLNLILDHRNIIVEAFCG